MTRLGFKQITRDNWLKPDEVLKGFVRMSPGAQVEPITGDDCLRAILRPKLLESVPTDVQALFEVARGALVYGYFFYPLYTLGAQQLFRVAEAAVAHKCTALGDPKSAKTFAKRVKRLADEGVVPKSDLVQWKAIRDLRNIGSHPKRQSIFTPGNAIGVLERITETINSLFEPQPPSH